MYRLEFSMPRRYIVLLRLIPTYLRVCVCMCTQYNIRRERNIITAVSNNTNYRFPIS